ncbi:hypothetical protein BBI11_14055 [Planococcus maritimus]|nr:hypothetical protein BBI11_14055 [Planococcus maritimus]
MQWNEFQTLLATVPSLHTKRLSAKGIHSLHRKPFWPDGRGESDMRHWAWVCRNGSQHLPAIRCPSFLVEKLYSQFTFFSAQLQLPEGPNFRFHILFKNLTLL